MAKVRAQSPQGLSARPTFDEWLEAAESLQKVRATDEELAFLAKEKSGRSHPIAREANRLGASLTRSASSRSDWTGEILVLLVCGYVSLQRGLSSFLPARCSSMADRDRLAVYLAVIALRMEDPWPAVRLVVWFKVLGPHAIRELMSRCDKHVGAMYAAVPGFPEADLPRLLAHLCKLSLNQTMRKGTGTHLILDDITRSAIVRSLNKGKLGANQQIALDNMHGALHEVLGRRILGNPLLGMVEALDGQYNNNPKFVAWQHLRNRSKEEGRKYRAIDVDINNEGRDDTDEENQGDKKQSRRSTSRAPELDEIPSPRLDPLEVLVREELAARDEARAKAFQDAVDTLCAGSARHRFGWRALQGEPLQALAEEAKKGRQAIARWRDTFENELRNMLKNKHKHLFL